MVVCMLKNKEQVFKKYWALPELRHYFTIFCELKGPFLILTFQVNTDVKHERVAYFKNVRVTEKISGNTLLREDGIIGFENLSNGEGSQASSIVIEDQVRLVRRVTNLMEDNIRIEGFMNVVKRASTMSRTKETGPGKDIAFETCVQAIIAEDSLENSFFNDSLRTSQILSSIAE